MGAESIESFIERYTNEKTDQEQIIVRHREEKPFEQNLVQMDEWKDLQFNPWWRRGEDVLRRSR